MSSKLFAVYLGGGAPKCNTELHDVVFAVGESIEDTYEQLMDKWFGTPKGLHLDSWMELTVVDGYEIAIADKKPDRKEKLFFINLGAYVDGEFTEHHANMFLVAESKEEAKEKGKAALSHKWVNRPHTDDLYDVDDCLEVGDLGGAYVVLEKTGAGNQMQPVNGYHLIPKGIVEDYMARKLKRAG